ncbi:MAG: radical SAM protein [Prevotella sp.]|nr:radical SAM protein [Prevotella sp.]
MQTIYQTAKPFDQLLKKQKMAAGQTYRPMYYVVEQPVEEGLLLYHTMTKAMLLLTPEEAETYRTSPTTLPQLVEQWFLVPESHDDRLLSRQIRVVARMLEKKTGVITSYTILTTTDCNARCFYCYELGRPRVPMSQDTAIKTADYIINHCKGEKVSIHWFGGEPLYNKPVISLICQRLKEAGIQYASKMTSNGYLFDDSVVTEAKEEWRLEKVQITLDGTEQTYNRCKAYIYKDVNAFHRVIGNIHKLQDAGIHVSIRLNIDMHNAENLSELADELHREFSDPKGISVYMHALFEEVKGSKAIHDEEKRKFVFDQINDIESRLADYGLLKPRQLKREVKTNRCMADNDHSVVIVPDGHIGKCEHYSEDHFVGHIGQEEWDAQMLDHFRDTRDEITACATCFNYPDCIWLKLCKDNPNCYQEEREHKHSKLRQSILRAFHHYKDQQEEIQDEAQD